MGKASFAPEDQHKVTAYDDIDVEIVAAKPVLFEFKNKEGKAAVAGGAPVALLTFQSLANPEIKFDEPYSVGAATIGEDGDSFDTGEQEGLADSSKFAIFCRELAKAGHVFKSRQVSSFVGVKGHLRGIDPPAGWNTKNKIKVFTKLLEGGGAAAGGADTAKVEELARKVVEAVVRAKAPNQVAKRVLATSANAAKSLAGNPLLPQVVATVINDQFLQKLAGEGVISFSNGQVGPAAGGEEAVDI